MTSREDFEKWITGPPFELTTKRFSNRGAWPGQYRDYQVELAWKAWTSAQTSILREARERMAVTSKNPLVLLDCMADELELSAPAKPDCIEPPSP